MRILAVDASTSVNATAVCVNGALQAETYADCGRAHSERLMDAVAWVLREAGLELRELDAIAASIGPGSFTGLRVGVAACKGLALGAGIPLIGVPTLDAMARLAAGAEGLVVPLLDAKMGEVFGARYRFSGGDRVKERDDAVAPVEALLEGLTGRTFFLGDGAQLYADRIRACVPDAAFAPQMLSMPRASAVALEAEAIARSGPLPDSDAVAPVYLRLSQPEETRRRAASSAS